MLRLNTNTKSCMRKVKLNLISHKGLQLGNLSLMITDGYRIWEPHHQL